MGQSAVQQPRKGAFLYGLAGSDGSDQVVSRPRGLSDQTPFISNFGENLTSRLQNQIGDDERR